MQFNIYKRFLQLVRCLMLFVLILLPFIAKAQFFDLTENRKRVTIPFRLVRNMVIVQLRINDKGPFNFILDTGVGIMVITDPKMIDSINITSPRTIKIFGLNGNSFEAFVTPNLHIDLPNITSYGVSAAILKEDHFGLSNYAGMPVHGLLGYDFFNSLAVKFSFNDSTITVSKPQYVRLLRKGFKIPITIEDRKPYMVARITMPNGRVMSNKLIIDIGAGHSISLENMLKVEGGLPQNFIAANLGVGLTGPINGFISRINEIDLGKYKLKNVIASFPDMTNINNNNPDASVKRDGNLGLGVLKRFTLILNYADNAMYIKPANTFKELFEHDMTGMEYYYAGEDFSHLVIGRVEPGSAADNVGLKPDDEITSINFRTIDRMNIEQIDALFRSREGRSLLLEVFRNKRYDKVILTLKRRI
jgi:hypothetical protein